MPELQALFVRHGDYTRYPEQQLSSLGIQQADWAGLELREQYNVGEHDLIVTSDAPRAVQTANLIAATLDNKEPIYKSHLLNAAGNHPQAVKSLRRLIDLVISDKPQHPACRNLVIVCHLPLLAEITGSDDIRNGQVVPYNIDAWQNSQYSSTAARTFLPELS